MRLGRQTVRLAGCRQPTINGSSSNAEHVGDRFGAFAGVDGRNSLSATPFEFRSGSDGSAHIC